MRKNNWFFKWKIGRLIATKTEHWQRKSEKNKSLIYPRICKAFSFFGRKIDDTTTQRQQPGLQPPARRKQASIRESCRSPRSTPQSAYRPNRPFPRSRSNSNTERGPKKHDRPKQPCPIGGSSQPPAPQNRTRRILFSLKIVFIRK